MFTKIQMRGTLSFVLTAVAVAFVPSAPFALQASVDSQQTYLSLYANEGDISGSIQVDKSGKSNVKKSSLPPASLPNGGRISMVGSGPGDPDLLTVAAYRMITDPDVFIISDRLVSKEILDLIKGEYKIARKLPGCSGAAQDEVRKW